MTGQSHSLPISTSLDPPSIILAGPGAEGWQMEDMIGEEKVMRSTGEGWGVDVGFCTGTVGGK